MNKMDERILVVDRSHLFDDESLKFQGISTKYPIVNKIMKRFEDFFEVSRGDAEENPNWKQPIPYVIVKRGDSVFVYERLKAGGESRLHDQLSIGIGGHMNVMHNFTKWTTLSNLNMLREINEEINIKMGGPHDIPKVVGLINDDENEVGRVHIGILAILELPEEAEVSVRETDKLDGYWIRIRDLKKTPLFEKLETWSQMAVEVL